jgi:hypothetical protein
MKEQIEEMALIMCGREGCKTCTHFIDATKCAAVVSAKKLYNAGYRKQKEGEWEWFEEWNPSTPEHPRECDDCGWRCGECKTALADIVGGYWDDPDKKPNFNFCPNCGAHMKGGAE